MGNDDPDDPDDPDDRHGRDGRDGRDDDGHDDYDDAEVKHRVSGPDVGSGRPAAFSGDDEALPRVLHKGRGAVVNPSGRFERFRLIPEPHDAAVDPDDPDAGSSRPRTIVMVDATRTIIARNDSPDVPFDQSINPYRGCEHGCTYCFARPSHSFLGLSPGLDFETRIFAKPEAPKLLAGELARKSYRCQAVALGANTDPYQPIEKRERITRAILEVLRDHCHPVTIVTKSALVLRDIDLLAPMAEKKLASVMVSVTTLDGELASTMEPRASAPLRRIAAIRGLCEAGIPVGVLASPMIPGLNDWELERILEAAREAGANWAGYSIVRLAHELKEIFSTWLQEALPTKAARVLNRIRDVRDGQLNDATWGVRHSGTGPMAELLARRFDVAHRRLGFATGRVDLDTTQFRVPLRAGDQRSLFS